jgi:hypothetical protein
MTSGFTCTLIASLAGALLAMPAVAEQPAGKKTPDPNEKICENIRMLGSRLAVRRICATRSEWAERRRQDRDVIDQTQRSPCVIQSTSSTGRATC